MTKQPTGKILLKNVIRHTDAHNKIQEEMEMWKMRDWEIQMSHDKHLSDTVCVRGHMHCDRLPDQSRDLSRSKERVSEHDDRETRYWSRKLYEFEANDPDRWGHSGFKELYPEEFESDSEKNSATEKTGRHKVKRSKSDMKASLSKRSKKSTRKKKKKKKKKKDEGERRKKAQCLSGDDSSDDSSATKDKQRRKRTKSRHKNKKAAKIKGRDEDSSSEDSDDEVEKERRAHSQKKRKPNCHTDSEPDSKKKRRKWKAAGEESSDDSSAD
ncbi:uncharacterized protein NKAPD1 isoform X1 [Mastacembelus armatus]|uniref:NKAP domain containing 1 n=2 Tax=Mastacembelus armatus TaxID=205130 RepID=A0A3Q3MU64_9TELE|nr:uncharacterized protein NKAPD1 isoform X1 [Mastacembelus armatus]